MIKVTNMIYAKNFNNVVEPTILKIDNMIFIFIKKKFVNMSIKSIVKFVLEKRKNLKIKKIYYLNVLLMLIIY